MHSFEDNNGRKWEIEIHVSAIKRVRDELKISLAPITAEGLASLAADDGLMLASVLYVLCAEQAKAAAVSEEEFGRGLAGDTLDAAVEALVGELTDFTRSPVRRKLWKTAWKQARALDEKGMARIEGQLRTGIFEEKLEEALPFDKLRAPLVPQTAPVAEPAPLDQLGVEATTPPASSGS